MNIQVKMLIVTLAVVAGCAQVIAGAPNAPAMQAGQPPITRLIIDFTPQAQKQSAEEAKFSDAAFNKAVGQELAARGLVDLANPAVVRVAAIEVDEFDVRAVSNVVVMGRVASAGVLGGRVRIRDGSGTQLREFHVRAEVKLTVIRTGKDKKGLEDLYREFALLIVDELTGTVRQPKQTRNR